MRAEEYESHRRLSLRASQHQMTKPIGTSGQGKCGGCALKAHVLIRGDLSDVAVQNRVVGHQPGRLVDQGPGARGAAASVRAKQAAHTRSSAARRRAIGERDRIEVSRGRISRARRKANAVKGRTRVDKEES